MTDVPKEDLQGAEGDAASLAPDERSGAEREAGRRTVVFLDAHLDPEQISRLEAGLGAEVRVVDPAELARDGVDDGDVAIVVPWDLGFQAGIDLVESLRRGEPRCEVPIVMVSGAPTQGQVVEALRAGATTFGHYPYDPDELRLRIESATASRPPD